MIQFLGVEMSRWCRDCRGLEAGWFIVFLFMLDDNYFLCIARHMFDAFLEKGMLLNRTKLHKGTLFVFV